MMMMMMMGDCGCGIGYYRFFYATRGTRLQSVIGFISIVSERADWNSRRKFEVSLVGVGGKLKFDFKTFQNSKPQ
jgi:hypothetical protein